MKLYDANITSSFKVVGDSSFSGSVNISGSLYATSSWAVTASFAMNGGGGTGQGFPYSGSASISGSLDVTGSVNSTGGFTGSLLGSSSWATNSLTASSADLFLIRENLTISDSKNILLGTTTGTKIGTDPTQKIGFFNATPIQQPTNTSSINEVIDNLGLRASGGISNFTGQLKFTSYTSTGSYAGSPQGYLGFDSSGNIVSSFAVRSRRSDFNSNYSYCGTAPFGSSDSSPVWKIVRILIASNGTVTSTGTAINVTWTGRLTHTYT